MTAPAVAVERRPRAELRVWVVVAVFAAAAVLFFLGNRGAYRGYFSDDDLDNLVWATADTMQTFTDGLLTPRFSEWNFRPTGGLYYHWLGQRFGLHYAPYVAVLQLLHALNAALLFCFLRRLGFSRAGSLAGTLFFAFNAVVLRAWWMPMFNFDVLCATFTLLTLILYVRGNWIWALLTFWLAYKSKEIAVMMPVALAAWEFLIGGRRWKRLIPYFAISLSFGLQALLHNRGVPHVSTYSLHFSLNAFRMSIAFYSSKLLFLPYLGLALLLLPLFIPDKRLVWGLIFACAMLFPLLPLSGRLLEVYLYAALIGVAVAAAALASRAPIWAVALFFVFWLPLNYSILREKRRAIIADGDTRRWFTTSLGSYAKNVPPNIRAVVYDSSPPGMASWGVEGAIHLVFGPRVEATWSSGPEANRMLASPPMLLIGYDPVRHSVRGLLRRRAGLESYLNFTDELPGYQFGSGWYGLEGALRWTQAKAEISLFRPADAQSFEIVAEVPSDSLAHDGPSHVTVYEDGRALGTATLDHSQPQHLHWKLSEAAPGDRRIVIEATPVRHAPPDQRAFGIAVHALGYSTNGN